MTTKGVILEQADRSFTHIEPHGGGASRSSNAPDPNEVRLSGTKSMDSSPLLYWEEKFA